MPVPSLRKAYKLAKDLYIHGLPYWSLGDVAVNLKFIIFKVISSIDVSSISWEIADM